MKRDSIRMKNLFLNASQKVVRKGLQRVFVIVLVKDEIRCCIHIHSNVPSDSTAVTCIKVLWIKQQLKPKLISSRFLPRIKLPKVSWKHADSLHKFSNIIYLLGSWVVPQKAQFGIKFQNKTTTVSILKNIFIIEAYVIMLAALLSISSSLCLSQ